VIAAPPGPISNHVVNWLLYALAMKTGDDTGYESITTTVLLGRHFSLLASKDIRYYG
jgi:hypothetical protein